MEIEILYRPGSSAAKVSLSPREEITAEGGAMIAMSGDMQITTSTKQKSGGGLFKAAKRLLSGESFFLNHFTAGHNGGELWLSTTLPGDMMTHELHGERLIVQGGSFVACEPGISIDLGWQGFKSILSGESVFWVNLAGTGKVIFNSFGMIYPIDITEEFIVDTGHIVAFEETLNFSITKAGKSWISSILGGEGLVCKFKGRGRLWCQSHNGNSFGTLLGPLLPPR